MTHGRGRWYSVTGAISASVVAATATAQAVPDAVAGQVQIARMEVQIWPEYDDPRVLVIYSGKLESGVAVPTRFSLLIPPGAQIHMAGALGDRGQHLHALFQTRPIGDSLAEVSYELETPSFYMEFYYDPFQTGRKEFRYPLVSPYPVGDLQVLVQQPLTAEAFRVAPAPIDVVRDDKGFSYHRVGFGMLGADEARSVSVAYDKPDRKPSIAAADQGSGGSGSAMKNILIISAVALVGALGYGTFASARRARGYGSDSTRARGPPPVAQRITRSTGRRKFCTECGAQLEWEDRFCPACGAEARKLM